MEELIESYGEYENEEWELIDSRKVDYELELELDKQIESWDVNLNSRSTRLSKIWNFISTGTARGNAKSKQDEKIDGLYFKVRYAYVGDDSSKSREFCDAMSSKNKIYRREDIIRMGEQGVNGSFAPKGKSNYSIWLYKGGANCHHYWERRTYVSASRTIDVNSPLAPEITESKARKYGYDVVNPKDVSTKPIDMPDNGYLNPRN